MSQPNPIESKVVYIGLEVPDCACESIMSTALEGGIGYWSVASNIKYANKDLNGPGTDDAAQVDAISYWSYELTGTQGSEGGDPDPAKFDQLFDAGHVTVTVNYGIIRLGIKRLFDLAVTGKWIAAQSARENFLCDYAEWLEGYPANSAARNRTPAGDQTFGGCMDADDCDLIVQLGIFGTAVYS